MAVPTAAPGERPLFFPRAPGSIRTVTKRCRTICDSSRRELLATSLIGLGTTVEAPAGVPVIVQNGGPLPAVPRTQLAPGFSISQVNPNKELYCCCAKPCTQGHALYHAGDQGLLAAWRAAHVSLGAASYLVSTCCL